MRILGFEITKAKARSTDATVEKATAPKAPQRPLGLVGLRTASGLIQEEFLRELQWPTAGKTYLEMSSNDAIIGGCLYLIETLIRRANWYVKPASDDPGDIEAAQFVESCMYDMQEQSWDDFICDALSMLTYGFSFHEIVYKVRRGPFEKDPKFKSKYTDGKIGWQELPIRSQVSISEWTYDQGTGKIVEVVQDPSIVGLEGDPINIPIAGNLLFKTKAARGNPEGWSILRRAYRSWYFKRYIEELEGIGIERNLAGIPVLAPPPEVPLFDRNNEQMVAMLDWSQRLVDGLRQDRNHGVVLPNSGWSLSLLGTSSGSRSIDTDTIIRRHESRIAMSMLSDIIVLGGDRTGSFALAEVKQNLFIASLQAIIGSIASTLNTKAVPMLFAVNNWAVEKLPTIVADDLKAPNPKEIALLLRSFKVDITKNKELFNFVLNLMQAPTLTQEQFDEFMSLQTELDDEYGPVDDLQDTADNDDKQSDAAYV